MKKLKITTKYDTYLSDIEVDGVSLYELLPTIHAVDTGLSRFKLSPEEMIDLEIGPLESDSTLVTLYLVWDRADLEVINED